MTVASVVSGLLSAAIDASIATSIIVCWWVMKRAGQKRVTASADDKELTAAAGTVHELTPVVYDVPDVIKEHTKLQDQSGISTQDNVAYGGVGGGGKVSFN